MDINKNFHGVIFPQDNSYAVVPKSWIRNKKSCLWPNYGDPELLSKEDTPPSSSWPYFSCRLEASASSYSKCMKRLTRGEASSSGIETMHKRVHPKSATEGEVQDDDMVETVARFIPNVPLAPSLDTSIVSQCNCHTELQEVKRQLQRMEEENKEFQKKTLEYLKLLIKQEKVNGYPGPAANEKELKELLLRPHLNFTLSSLETPDLNETIRNMLQKILAKPLAEKFSFTGLGQKRKREGKLQFSGHPAYGILNDALKKTRFRDVHQPTIDKAIQEILRRASDWNGGRSKNIKTNGIAVSKRVKVTERPETIQLVGQPDTIQLGGLPDLPDPIQLVDQPDPKQNDLEGVEGLQIEKELSFHQL